MKEARAEEETELLTPLPVDVARRIGAARRLVWNAAARALAESGESILFFQVLARLSQNGPCVQRELAEAVAQHPAGVSRVLAELEAEGLVRRRRSEEDRRKVVVEATRAGRARFEAGRPAVRAAVEEGLSPLSGAELRRLRGLLGKLTET